MGLLAKLGRGVCLYEATAGRLTGAKRRRRNAIACFYKRINESDIKIYHLRNGGELSAPNQQSLLWAPGIYKTHSFLALFSFGKSALKNPFRLKIKKQKIKTPAQAGVLFTE